MVEIIKRNLNFIEWSNFTSVDVLAKWGIALLQIHLFLILAVIVSGVAVNRKRLKFHNSTEEFVLRSGLGIAILSFFLTAIAFLQMLYFPVFIGGAFLLIAISFYLNKNELSTFLKESFRGFLPYKYIWLFMVFSSLSSLLPPVWIDESSFHISYPWQWVQNGGLFIDEAMRLPVYTLNFQMLHTISAFLNSYEFNHLLSWLCGSITVLGIFAILERFNVWKPIQYIAAAAFFFTPVVQQYLNISYIDVSLNFYLFLSAYTILILKEDNGLQPQMLCAVVCAMFVGMKTPNSFFVVLFIPLIWYGNNFKKILPALLVFSVLGAIWYLRNFIVTGDPMPPALMALGHEDPFWTRADYEWMSVDVRPVHDWGWRIIYKLPIELLVSEAGRPLRYWSLLPYFVLFPATIFLFFSKETSKSVKLLLIITFYAAFLWLAISYFTRYVHFIALSIVLFAVFINLLKTKTRFNFELKSVKIISVFLIFVLFFGSGLKAFAYYKHNFSKKIPVTQSEIYAHAGWYLPPYIGTAIENFENLGVKKGSNIYGLNLMQHRFYFVERNYRLCGDGVGTYRFADFFNSLNNNNLQQYFAEKNLQYLIFDTRVTNEDIIMKLENNGLQLLYKDSCIYFYGLKE